MSMDILEKLQIAFRKAFDDKYIIGIKGFSRYY